VRVCVCACVRVCVSVTLSLCKYVCLCVCVSVCLCFCVSAPGYVDVYGGRHPTEVLLEFERLGMHVCIHVSVNVCTHERLAFLHDVLGDGVCVRVCVSVCVCVCVCARARYVCVHYVCVCVCGTHTLSLTNTHTHTQHACTDVCFIVCFIAALSSHDYSLRCICRRTHTYT
jgi:hypothetical protein